MGFKTDIQIAQECQMAVVNEIADKLEIKDDYVENYGKYKAKIDYRMLKDYQDTPNGKLILVTAINPTPAGEGKTTTSVNYCRFRGCTVCYGQKNCYRSA